MINKDKMQEKESKTKQHFYTSLAKSVVRIAAGITLCYGDLLLAGSLLIAAEVLGVIEEL
jgi:2-keto-4-pentenoate hydratase/2-oxohepta-3-ene-1,7-dioic acid hydratase in catechol pathway